MTNSPILLTLERSDGYSKEKIILSNVPSWEAGDALEQYTACDLPISTNLQFVVKAQTSNKIILISAENPQHFLRRTLTKELRSTPYNLKEKLHFEWKLLWSSAQNNMVGKTFRLSQSSVSLLETPVKHDRAYCMQMV